MVRPSKQLLPQLSEVINSELAQADECVDTLMCLSPRSLSKVLHSVEIIQDIRQHRLALHMHAHNKQIIPHHQAITKTAQLKYI